MKLPKHTMSNLTALTRLSELRGNAASHNIPESHLEALEVACDVLVAIEALCIPVHGEDVANG